MIPAVVGVARAALMSQVRAIVQRAAAAEMRSYSRSELRRMENVAFDLTGDRFVAKRFARLENKVRKKISWNAMRDALNEYRNRVRRNWRSVPVARPTRKTRSAIARGYGIRRMDGDTLAVGVLYSKPRARKANLLEWDTRKTRGKLVGTNTFEESKAKLFRIIAESVRVQILQDPENSKARRQAVRARAGAL